MMRLSMWVFFCALLLTKAMADPAQVRVAIVSDADEKDLAALVTTELSSDSGVSIVERDDLAKVGDEAKLQQLAGSDASALGKLIGADGLLFLNKTPAGIEVRFTAVGLRAPCPAPPETWRATRFQGYSLAESGALESICRKWEMALRRCLSR
jgi:hypothetical protein